ncbi:MAG: O-antigen ligase family protein [Actinomycetota bacterium]
MNTASVRSAAPTRLLPVAVCGLIVPLGPLLLSEAASGSIPKVLVALAFAAALPAAVVRPDLFVNAGLLLVASDRFMARDVGALTLKPAYIAFGFAFLGALVEWARRPEREALRDVPRLLLVSAGGLLLLYVIAAGSADHRSAALRYLLVIGGGALVPIAAILGVARTPERIARAAAFFVLGELLVALYGLYQFAAAYLDLPAPVPATSTLPNSTTGVKRVDGISLEAAYHAAYAVTGLPLIYSDAIRRVRRIHRRLSPTLIAAVVTLAFFLTVSRAGYLALPFILLGVWLLHRRSEGSTETHSSLPTLAVVVGVGVLFAVVAATRLHILGPIGDHLKNLLNPNEQTSNSVRVGLYDHVVDIVRDHPWLGIGPDNLGYVLPGYGVAVFPGAEHTASANDIWLQGAADAGLLTIPFMAGVIWATLGLTRRRGTFESRTLALGAALFLLVSGALVSFMWDMKFWAVLGLAVVAQRAPPSTSAPPLIQYPASPGPDRT